MRVSPLGLALPLITATLAAQTPPIPPAVTKFTTGTAATGSAIFVPPPFPALNLAGAATATTTQQLELRHAAGSQVLYRLAATVSGLLPALGGVGGTDVVEAVYDAGSQTVVQLTDRAAAFNTAGPESSLSISEDGLVGVCVGLGAVPKWAARATPDVAFGPTAPIAGVPATEHAKLYTQGNQLRYAFASASTGTSTAIFAGDFTGGVVTNVRMVIPASIVPGARGVHSPAPVTQELPAGSGQWALLGWLFSATVPRAGGGIDMDVYWLPMHDGTVGTSAPPVALPLSKIGRQQLRGTALGASGTTFWPNRMPLDDPYCIAMVAMNGDTVPAAAGGRVDLRVMVEWEPSHVFSAVISFGLPAGPIPIPFAIGNPLGQPAPVVPPGLLGISPIVNLQQSVDPAAPGGVTFSFDVAAGTLPAGVPVPMQAIAIDFTTLELFTGNTAVLEGL